MWRILPWAAVGALLAGLPGPAGAWNSIGHMAVAKLAYEQFGDGHKKKLYTLLQKHPHFAAHLAAGRPDDVSEVEWVIVRSSIWPDWVRPRKGDTRGADVTKYNRPEDHYVNVPLIDPKDADFFAGKTLINPDLTNILDALKQRCNELHTKTAADADKAVAICWIFHLVGDIHQPLHNVAYFSSDQEFVGGDLGGNKFGIRVAGRKTKLHTYWDDLLGEDSDYGDDTAAHQQEIYRKALDVADKLRARTLAEADQDTLKRNTTFASWSQESHELAKKHGYQKSDGSGLLPGVAVKFSGFIPNDAPEVGPAYIEAARAVAEVRVILAGQRLAQRFKQLLGK